jgi:hypothetical protein
MIVFTQVFWKLRKVEERKRRSNELRARKRKERKLNDEDRKKQKVQFRCYLFGSHRKVTKSFENALKSLLRQKIYYHGNTYSNIKKASGALDFPISMSQARLELGWPMDMIFSREEDIKTFSSHEDICNF